MMNGLYFFLYETVTQISGSKDQNVLDLSRTVRRRVVGARKERTRATDITLIAKIITQVHIVITIMILGISTIIIR
jgi:hypothetical protein